MFVFIEKMEFWLTRNNFSLSFETKHNAIILEYYI